jgi:hypothetical protein
MSEGMRSAYSELFERNEYAHTKYNGMTAVTGGSKITIMAAQLALRLFAERLF